MRRTIFFNRMSSRARRFLLRTQIISVRSQRLNYIFVAIFGTTYCCLLCVRPYFERLNSYEIESEETEMHSECQHAQLLMAKIVLCTESPYRILDDCFL